MSDEDDVIFIMREVKELAKFGGALQTVIGFLFWLSAEHPEIFEEYLKSKEE